MSDQNNTQSARRKFLAKAAGTAAGTAAIAFPSISVAQSPITLRFQSTWPAKDIFHEFAQDYAKLVNDMSGGRLKIDVLPAGSVVKAFDLLCNALLPTHPGAEPLVYNLTSCHGWG